MGVWVMNTAKQGFLEGWVARIPAGFGRTRPHVHYWIFGPLLIAQLVWAAHLGILSRTGAAGLFAGGLVSWTLLEYVLHRFSFHSPSEHPLVRPFNSGLHALHHRNATDRHYVGAPVILAFPVYLAALAAFRLAGGSLVHALVMGSGLLTGFLLYEFVHFTAHLRSPKTRAMKYLKKHHMLHHFADSRNHFGVTSPFWDLVFGTHKRTEQRKSRQISPISKFS
jgi:sterol desaturase/sphingolipid hydroxylase (fatty acid hydroxylase superfamily)